MFKFLIKIALVLLILFSTSITNADKYERQNYAIIGGQKVYLMVADTFVKRVNGLMHMKKLPHNYGMIFLFEEPAPKRFWMKNVKFPIDIIFIRNSKIIKIHKNAQPSSGEPHKIYPSIETIDLAIEVNAGYCEKFGIKEGDLIELSHPLKLKQENLLKSH